MLILLFFYSSNNDRWDVEFIAFAHNLNLHRDDDADVLSEVHQGLLCLSVSITALAASFESGSSVLYTLQEPFSGILNEEARRSPARFHDAEVTKSQEKVSFGFLTHHVPALILTAHTLDQHYMAVMLSSNGTKSYVTLKLGEKSSFAHFHIVLNLYQAQKRTINNNNFMHFVLFPA